MAKKKDIPTTGRFIFMCERLHNTSYSKEFDTKEEVLEYVENLNDPKIAWYGVYEKDFIRDILIGITHHRFFETTVLYPNRESSKESSAKHKQRSK